MATININDLTFGYDGSSDNIFEHVNLCLDTSWKLGFIGRNGCGKTTMLRLLMGDFEYTGSITSDARFVYFSDMPSDCSELTMDIIRGKFYPVPDLCVGYP